MPATKSEPEDLPRDAELPAINERPTVTDRLGKVLSVATRADGKPIFPGWYVSGSTMMVGRNAAMQTAFKRAQEFATDARPIWIFGPAGTGKYTLARQIHAASRFKTGLFLAENCAVWRGAQMQTMLFGREFTRDDHVTGRVFKVGESNRWSQSLGGVLFLQNIEYVDLTTQGEIARALASGFYRGAYAVPAGSMKLIVSSMRDLDEIALEGRMSGELLKLLKPNRIDLPPLAKRADDVSLLVDYFLRLLCQTRGYARKLPAKQTLEDLKRMPWRGNVRELEAACKQALERAKGNDLLTTDFVTIF